MNYIVLCVRTALPAMHNMLLGGGIFLSFSESAERLY